MPATHSRASTPAARHANHEQKTSQHYGRLVLMTVLSFAAMYGLMYAMIDSLSGYYNNLNQAYMAGLMAAAMVVIELAVMGSMYSNRKLKAAVVALSILALMACWALIRTQGGIGDEQFLRSMIPHHSGAILMCEKAAIRDAEIQKLCGEIIASQRAEIDQMKAKLRELE